jgi:hypothetical protein
LGVIQADVGKDTHLVPELDNVPRDVPPPNDPYHTHMERTGGNQTQDTHPTDMDHLTDLGSEAASDTEPDHDAGKPTRPDLTLVTRDAAGRINRIFLIEVKFGPDTRLERKIQPALEKLAPLVQSLSTQYACPATPVVVTIGVGGRIPNASHQALRMVLPGSVHMDQLLKDLNKHAISWLHSIVQARRQLEPD